MGDTVACGLRRVHRLSEKLFLATNRRRELRRVLGGRRRRHARCLEGGGSYSSVLACIGADCLENVQKPKHKAQSGYGAVAGVQDNFKVHLPTDKEGNTVVHSISAGA